MRLRPRQVNSAILQLLAVEDRDGNQPAGLGLAHVAGPLQHGNGPQLRGVFVFLGDLPGILSAGGSVAAQPSTSAAELRNRENAVLRDDTRAPRLGNNAS